MASRIFSYEDARALIPRVRELTEEAHQRMESIRDQLNAQTPGSKSASKLSEWINQLIQDWADEIESLGAQSKGLWTVDFDSGEGLYYCWTRGETDLTHFHHYEEGFAGRRPLTEIGKDLPPPLLN